MKKIIKIFSLSNYSFSTKVIFSFFIFVIFFMLFKTILTIPRVENNALNDNISHIARTISLTKEKFHILGKSLKMQSSLEIELNKKKIENQVFKLESQNSLSKTQLIEYLDKSLISKYCSYKITTNNSDYKYVKNLDFFSENNTKETGVWGKKSYEQIRGFRKKEYYIYNKDLKLHNSFLELICDYSSLNPNHMSFEMDLKESVYPKTLIDSSLKTTKIALVLLNTKNYKSMNERVLEENKELRKGKYTISMLSNVENIPTGNLTLNELFNHKSEKEPIFHKVGEKEFITWVIKLVERSNSRYFFLIYTIEKEEILNKIRTRTLLLLPETLIAIGISFLLMLFFFKRVLRNLNTLTKTAIAVNNGEKNIRSNVKGEDDIGILGKSFDSMLDFFEDSINCLDKKVDEKTKEISKSLEEKETLLKEIHHRVKII